MALSHQLALGSGWNGPLSIKRLCHRDKLGAAKIKAKVDGLGYRRFKDRSWWERIPGVGIASMDPGSGDWSQVKVGSGGVKETEGA